MTKSIFSSMIMLFSVIIPASAAVRHVPDEYVTIQSAIDICNSGDTIIVKPGTYIENINFLGKNLTVTSTNPQDPNITAATIIDGNNAGSVVTFANGENSESILSGFTITGGYGTISPQFEENIYWGAGIYCDNASPTIKNNIIIDNHGPIEEQSETMSFGAGVGCYNSNAIVTRNIIKDNSAYAGGGIMAYFGELTICNNIISNNSAYIGGGVVLLGGNLINNTITENDSDISEESGAGNVYAIFEDGYYESLIINNIICNAKSGSGVYLAGSWDTSSFAYNNVWGNLPGNYFEGTAVLTGINGNISNDPLFLDDFHIGVDSPCYNAGNPNYTPYLWQLDIDGQYATMDSSIDIGADEVIGNARPAADAGDIQHFNTLVPNVTLDGTGSYDPDTSGTLTYQWRQISGPNAVLFNPDTPEPNFAPPSENAYVFELIVFDGNLYSSPDSVTIIVGNRAPIAEAGNNQTCAPGQQVTLSSSGSYDPDMGDILSYSWAQISGPAGELLDANTPTPRFIPSSAGEYVLALTVSDGAASSLPDTVTINCKIGSEPDAYGYSWIDSDNPWGPKYHWIDISNARGKITDLENSLQESFGPFYLGFHFNFYDKTYDKCYIQSDGMISFGPEPITYSNRAIPQADGYNNIIAWMWALLYPLDGSVIYYKSFSDCFIVQFSNYTIYSNDSIVDAQVILYKSGKIVIQYKDFSDDNYNSSYTVGIENSDGTIGTQVAYNKYGYLHDELAIEFSLGGPYEPVAKAGPDQQYKNIVLVTLDGTGSIDRDPNDVLTYHWTQTGGPSVVLSDPNAAMTSFMPETEGLYLFQLVVSDGLYTSYPDEISVFIGNRAPVADAGQNIACEPNQIVNLDGSNSYDLDTADILTFSWRQISGPAVNIENADSRNSYFVSNKRGEYVFELIVSDGIEQSSPDTILVVCGMGSAPDNYGYRWIDNKTSWGPKFNWMDIQGTGTQVSGIESTYEGSFGPFPFGFEFNFYGNIYDHFYIQVCGLISFDPEPINYNNKQIPRADEYNNIIAWMWTIFYPSVNSKIFYQPFDGYMVVQFVDYNLNNGGTVNAEVIMYESGRIVIQFKDFSENAYLYQHTVGIENSDGTIGTQAAYNQYDFLHDGLILEFSPGAYKPVADAGENQYHSNPVIVTLDGSGSYTYDPEGITSYHWRQTGGTAVTLSDANSANPTFMSDGESQYTFELIVSDNIYQSNPDVVLISVHNLPPIANAGANQLLKVIPPVINLNGSGSYDPLQDALLYTWNQISGPAAILNDSNIPEPNFVPTEYGVYEFELIVNDGTNSSSPDTVLIILDNGFFPIADAGGTVYSEGGSVSLNGTRSCDPDGQPAPLMYSWVQISGPTAVITSGNTAAPVISGVPQTNSIQICEFELVVFDGEYFSFPDTVELKVIPIHPASTFVLANAPFDPKKPTLVYFDGGDCVTSNSSWRFASEWGAKANTIYFSHFEPDSSSGSRTYYHCGDMLIRYLSSVAPYYNQAIQTYGYSTGGQPAIDAAIRLNLTYKDARYAVNRISFIDGMCRDYTQDIYKFMENPVDGEQNWIDEFCSTTSLFYPGIMATQVSQGDHGVPPPWYNDSITNTQKNLYNGGIVAGWYWSVIGPGKNFQLSRTRYKERIYRYLWTGTSTSGSLGFYNESQYPAKMLGLVTLATPYGFEDSNGVFLSCLECENAVGYQVLVGTDPNRVMDFKVVSDTPEPPDALVTEFPAEQFWWTVRAYDQYDSTIYADPKFINLQMLPFPVMNLTTKITYLTIQDAIDKAVSGDEILVEPGIYQENINFQNKNLRITSLNPDDPAVTAETIIESTKSIPAVTISGSHDVNCLLSGFTITGKDNGIYCSDFSSPTISKCRIIGNSLNGIKMYSGCRPVITDCDIMNNSGSGIIMELTTGRYKYDNFPIIANSVISGNKQYGITKGKPTLINCTIADNKQYGIYNSDAIVTNSIIYFNGDGSAAAQITTTNSTVTYSDVQGSWSGTGNINTDPLFADHVNGNYYLMSQTGRWDAVNLNWVQDSFSSPCIDAGDPNSDIGLEPVPNGSVINMGAYGGTDHASKSP